MLEDALQNAVDGVWSNTLGRLSWLVPDWLGWLFSYSLDVWALVAIAFVAGMVAGKWGLKALAAAGVLIVAVFTLGRRSKSGSDDIAPHTPPIPKPDPRRAGPAPRRKTLLERLFKRGG